MSNSFFEDGLDPRAEEVYDQTRINLIQHYAFTSDQCDKLFDMIADAIKETRKDAFDKAALLAEDLAEMFRTGDGQPRSRRTAEVLDSLASDYRDIIQMIDEPPSPPLSFPKPE